MSSKVNVRRIEPGDVYYFRQDPGDAYEVWERMFDDGLGNFVVTDICYFPRKWWQIWIPRKQIWYKVQYAPLSD